MNRRHLFNLVLGAAIAPEELIKPAVTYFLPPRGGWGSGGKFTVVDLRRPIEILNRSMAMEVNPPLLVTGEIGTCRGFNILPGNLHWMDDPSPVQVYESPWPALR